LRYTAAGLSYRIIYVDSPTFDDRLEFAKRIERSFSLPVDAVISIEEFAAHLRKRKYALIDCSDSMMFQDKVVQGWSTLVKFLSRTRKDDLSKFILLTNRPAVIEEATLAQVQAFQKIREYDRFVEFARLVVQSVTES